MRNIFSTVAGDTPSKANSLGIIVGPDTTFFTGPLRPDGSVDYVAALNEAESNGATQENNAACVFLRIKDPDLHNPEDLERRAKILYLLGEPVQRAGEVNWQNWPGFQNPLPTDDPQAAGFIDRFWIASVRPWSSHEMPDLAAWLKSNDDALNLAALASRCPKLFVPIVLPPGESEISADQSREIQTLYKLRQAFCIRSMLKLHDGDASGALDDLFVMQRLGALFGQSPNWIALLWSAGCRAAADESAWGLLQESKLPAARLAQLSADLIAMGPVPRLEDHVIQRCRIEFLCAAQCMAGTINKNLDYNRILRLGNGYYDALLKDRSALSAEQRDAELKALNDWTTQIEKVYSGTTNGSPLDRRFLESRNAYSDRVAAITLKARVPLMHGMRELIRRVNEQWDWTARAGVALAIYRQDHGEYPASLDALIPKYLPQLPDNTSPNPVAYERRGTGYVIRNAREYSAQEKSYMAHWDQDYDPNDIIIRTDQIPK